MDKLNWKWDGIWCSSGDRTVWTTSMTSFEMFETKTYRWGDLLPSILSHIDYEPDWEVVKSETEGNEVDLWETTIEGIHLIIYNA